MQWACAFARKRVFVGKRCSLRQTMLLRPLSIGSCFFFAGAIALSCRPTPAPHDASAPPATSFDAGIDAIDAATAALLDAAVPESATPGDPMANQQDTQDGLLSLFSIKPFTDEEKARLHPDAFLHRMFDVTGPSHANQGNKAIAQHKISKEQCLAGLKGITLQTPEQKEKCGGAENMVPVPFKSRDGKEGWYCIDIFEFPNKACELPMVWTQPPLAKKVCELQGKRLCADTEWNTACRADPAGGPDQRYAYGDKLDLEICHTNLRHRQACVVQDSGTTWKTCTTDTEPSGAYPKCRSRYGVFDQHGNVAEVMTRREGDKIFTQLKGSAWFYVELAKEPKEPPFPTTTNKAGAYNDDCNFDPRWHVEELDKAMHVNYHLGFRCCKTIP